MQMEAALRIASSAICFAVSVVCFARAFAAAMAYAPPDPIAMIPSSGSIRSPLPDRRYVGWAAHAKEQAPDPPQHAVGPPVFDELDDRALQIAAMLFELRLE